MARHSRKRFLDGAHASSPRRPMSRRRLSVEKYEDRLLLAGPDGDQVTENESSEATITRMVGDGGFVTLDADGAGAVDGQDVVIRSTRSYTQGVPWRVNHVVTISAQWQAALDQLFGDNGQDVLYGLSRDNAIVVDFEQVGRVHGQSLRYFEAWELPAASNLDAGLKVNSLGQVAGDTAGDLPAISQRSDFVDSSQIRDIVVNVPLPTAHTPDQDEGGFQNVALLRETTQRTPWGLAAEQDGTETPRWIQPIAEADPTATEQLATRPLSALAWNLKVDVSRSSELAFDVAEHDGLQSVSVFPKSAEPPMSSGNPVEFLHQVDTEAPAPRAEGDADEPQAVSSATEAAPSLGSEQPHYVANTSVVIVSAGVALLTHRWQQLQPRSKDPHERRIDL